MKKVIFENVLRAFLATFCFLLLGTVAVSAQGKLTSVAVVPGVNNPPAPSSPLYELPQGNFVNTLTAHSKLDAAMLTLKTDVLLASNVGDPIFEAALIEYKYYQSIKNHLWAGADTRNAIAAGLWIFLDNAVLGSTPQSTQAALKAKAVALLQQ